MSAYLEGNTVEMVLIAASAPPPSRRPRIGGHADLRISPPDGVVVPGGRAGYLSVPRIRTVSVSTVSDALIRETAMVEPARDSNAINAGIAGVGLLGPCGAPIVSTWQDQMSQASFRSMVGVFLIGCGA